MYHARQRRVLLAVLTVLVVLLSLSLVVDSPATNAAPELYAALVLLAFAAVIVRRFAADRLLLGVAAAFVVGAVGSAAEGLAALDLIPTMPTLSLVGEAALVVGIVLFLYWRT